MAPEHLMWLTYFETSKAQGSNRKTQHLRALAV